VKKLTNLKNIKNSNLIVIVIIFIVLEIIVAKISIANNNALQLQIEHSNITQEALIVPNSQRETYKPAQKQTILSSFVENMAKSFLSYTPDTIIKQLQNITPYMSSAMLSRYNNYLFRSLTRLDRMPSSIFMLDRSLTEIFEQEVRVNSKTGMRIKSYVITVKGKRQYMDNGILLPPEDESVQFTVQETMISESNQYGLILTKFDLSKIKK
jgi:hypothetical protein